MESVCVLTYTNCMANRSCSKHKPNVNDNPDEARFREEIDWCYLESIGHTFGFQIPDVLPKSFGQYDENGIGNKIDE